jgi:hypothetical protein
MSDNITKTMLSCEDKAGAIANDFLNIGKLFQQMGLMDRIRSEVVLLNDIATSGIRMEFEKKQPNAAQIIKELQQSIADGYKGLSLQLSNEILNF